MYSQKVIQNLDLGESCLILIFLIRPVFNLGSCILKHNSTLHHYCYNFIAR